MEYEIRKWIKWIKMSPRWFPSAMAYGTTATLALVYFTDWKVVGQYIPFYGSKFQEEGYKVSE